MASRDNDQPATRRELAQVEKNVRTEIEGVDRRLMRVEGDVKDLNKKTDRLEKKTDRLERIVTRVLEIVQQIDQRTRGWDDIPKRVTKLEDRVTKI